MKNMPAAKRSSSPDTSRKGAAPVPAKAMTPAAKPAMVTAAPVAAAAVPTGAMAAVPVRREDAYRWARYLAEFIGTFLIAFVVTATNAQMYWVPNLYRSGWFTFLEPILAQVFIYAAMYAVFRHVSGGHFNPTITWTYMWLFEIGWIVGVMYILFQTAGAICGALLAWGVFSETIVASPIMDPSQLCTFRGEGEDTCTALPYSGRHFLVEVIGATVVAFVFALVDLSRTVYDAGFVAIGMTYGAFFFSLKLFSNAFFNPAVALGAAVASESYDWHGSRFWLYIIAPLIASFASAFFYGFFFQREGHGTGPHYHFWSNKNRRPHILEP